MRNILITYDQGSAQCTPEQFVTFLSVHKNILSWSVPFAGVAMIKTNAAANDIYYDLKKILGGKNILFAEVDVSNTGGAMPRGFWNWFGADSVTPELITSISSGEKG